MARRPDGASAIPIRLSRMRSGTSRSRPPQKGSARSSGCAPHTQSEGTWCQRTLRGTKRPIGGIRAQDSPPGCPDIVLGRCEQPGRPCQMRSRWSGRRDPIDQETAAGRKMTASMKIWDAGCEGEAPWSAPSAARHCFWVVTGLSGRFKGVVMPPQSKAFGSIFGSSLNRRRPPRRKFCDCHRLF
jgi:hypothetical protein